MDDFENPRVRSLRSTHSHRPARSDEALIEVIESILAVAVKLDREELIERTLIDAYSKHCLLAETGTTVRRDSELRRAAIAAIIEEARTGVRAPEDR